MNNSGMTGLGTYPDPGPLSRRFFCSSKGRKFFEVNVYRAFRPGVSKTMSRSRKSLDSPIGSWSRSKKYTYNYKRGTVRTFYGVLIHNRSPSSRWVPPSSTYTRIGVLIVNWDNDSVNNTWGPGRRG